MGALVISLITIGYFVQADLYQSSFNVEINTFYLTMPLYFDRFRYLTLSYNLLRERILMNNSLSSFESDPVYGYNIDYKYLDLSILNEQTIINLKNNHPPLLQDLVDLLS